MKGDAVMGVMAFLAWRRDHKSGSQRAWRGLRAITTRRPINELLTSDKTFRSVAVLEGRLVLLFTYLILCLPILYVPFCFPCCFLFRSILPFFSLPSYL